MDFEGSKEEGAGAYGKGRGGCGKPASNSVNLKKKRPKLKGHDFVIQGFEAATFEVDNTKIEESFNENQIKLNRAIKKREVILQPINNTSTTATEAKIETEKTEKPLAGEKTEKTEKNESKGFSRWTAEESALFVKCVKKYGRNWASIIKDMGGCKTEQQLRTRGILLHQKLKKDCYDPELFRILSVRTNGQNTEIIKEAGVQNLVSNTMILDIRLDLLKVLKMTALGGKKEENE